MFLSESEFQRWMSFDMIPAISNAKIPTFDFFNVFRFETELDLAASNLWDIAVFTFINQVSSAMVRLRSSRASNIRTSNLCSNQKQFVEGGNNIFEEEGEEIIEEWRLQGVKDKREA